MLIADRRLEPLFEPEVVSAPEKASQLTLARCLPQIAVALNRAWHSRLPEAQDGPWKYTFAAHYRSTAFAVALWHNTSARDLPQDWLELRRLAVAPDAPHCAASWMLGAMAKWLRRRTTASRLISYQDVEVHTGTIYKAAGWNPAYFSPPLKRDRTLVRRGTRREYRSDMNGSEPAHAGKIRWELEL